MKGAIAILANNLSFFETFCKNYPEELIEDIPLYVFNETRIGDKRDQLKNILDDNGITRYRVVGTDDVHKALRDVITINEFAEDYSYSLNILIPLFMFKKTSVETMLQLDDDIILRDGIIKIFDETQMLFYRYIFCAGGKEFKDNSKNFQILMNDFMEMIDGGWTYEGYRKNYANSGTVLYQRKIFDMEEYIRCLNWFFESKVTSELWYSWEGKKKRNPMLMDEKWTTFVFRKYLNNEIYKKGYAYLICENVNACTNDKALKKMEKYSIIHICNSNQKQITYDKMKEKGFIKC